MSLTRLRTPFVPLTEIILLTLLILLCRSVINGFNSLLLNPFLYDDAYIGFRYSAHLAAGHGLVWNIGGPPTHGYTNFLFVVLTALGLGAHQATDQAVLIVRLASTLNLYGIGLIALSAYAVCHFLIKTPYLRLLPAAILTVAPLTMLNAVTGMETVFWAGLVAAAGALAFCFWRVRNRWLLVGFVVAAYLGCLTRPESVLFAALWFALLFLSVKGQRRAVLIAGLIFGIAGAAYALWLQSYFGAILPNAFYVKVADPGLLPGRAYIEDFLLSQVWAMGPILLGVFGLLLLPRRMLIGLLAFSLPPLTLLPFYLFTYPLMGFYHRFVFPAAVVILFLVFAGWAILIERTLIALSKSVRALRPVWARGVIGLLILVGLSYHFLTPAARVMFDLFPGNFPQSQYIQDKLIEQNSLFIANRRFGEALARLSAVQEITVAYNDVGIMPFVSGAKNLDTVGLNDNEIARHGKERGWLWAVGYVLGSRPDVIGFYTFPDGTVYNYGHGIIGGYYSVLADARDFKDNYTFIGAYDADWVHIQWFVLNVSPYAANIRTVVQDTADFRTHPLRIP